MNDYYIWLNNLLQSIVAPLHTLSYQFESVPLLAAFILGMIGVFSPCQLSTNVAVLSYASRGIAKPEGCFRSVLAYTLGKMLVYSVVGLAVIGLGMQLELASVPVVVAVRKALGPPLIVVGLVLLGWLRFRFSLVHHIGRKIEHYNPGHGDLGAFVMGVAFSFAACPTLFVLFFGVLAPLAMTTHIGLILPAIFAVGTTFPILVTASLIDVGWVGVANRVSNLSRIANLVTQGAGVIFVLIGVNEILLYWTF